MYKYMKKKEAEMKGTATTITREMTVIVFTHQQQDPI